MSSGLRSLLNGKKWGHYLREAGRLETYPYVRLKVVLQLHPAQLASGSSDGTRSGIIELHVAGSVGSGDTETVGLEPDMIARRHNLETTVR